MGKIQLPTKRRKVKHENIYKNEKKKFITIEGKTFFDMMQYKILKDEIRQICIDQSNNNNILYVTFDHNNNELLEIQLNKEGTNNEKKKSLDMIHNEKIIFDPLRHGFICSMDTNIYCISLQIKKLTLLVGSRNGDEGYRNGIGDQAQFAGAFGMVLDSKCEKLYVCDTENNAVRCVDMQTKNVTTFVGEDPDGNNNNHNDKEMNNPYLIAMDPDENNLIVTEFNHMDHIKLVNIRSKVVSTVAFLENPPKFISDLPGYDKHWNMVVDKNHHYLYHFNRVGIYRFSLKNTEDKEFIFFLQQQQNNNDNDLNILIEKYPYAIRSNIQINYPYKNLVLDSHGHLYMNEEKIIYKLCKNRWLFHRLFWIALYKNNSNFLCILSKIGHDLIQYIVKYI